MPETIGGLPLHPLVVHAVVVLVPLAALGVLALAVRPRWRPTYGPLVIAITALATVLTPLATSSGEELAEAIGEPEEHAELGDQLIFFMLPLLILAVALWWLDRRDRAASLASIGSAGIATTTGSSTVTKVVAVLAVLAALGTSVQVLRIGHSGAEATWNEEVSNEGGSGGGDDGD